MPEMFLVKGDIVWYHIVTAAAVALEGYNLRQVVKNRKQTFMVGWHIIYIDFFCIRQRIT